MTTPSIPGAQSARASARPSAQRLAFGLLALLLPSMTMAADANCELAAPASRTISLSALADGPALATVPAGANSLYFMEVDSTWATGKVQQALRTAAVRSLRFPGGELADNYDWQQHRLVNPKDWPGDAQGEERAARTDYLEFLAQARALGIKDIYFVVNVDSAFHARGDRQENVRLWAKKAAAWVKAVKDAGYSVPYWEIGNEPYLASGFPMSVAEYAQVVRLYAEEMRAVDPSIRIGASGPLQDDGVGFADKLTPAQLELLRSTGGGKRGQCGKGASNKECVAKLQRAAPGKGANDEWWPTLARLAPGSFDFAVVHRYDRTRPGKDSEKNYVVFADRLQALSARLASVTGRPVPVSVTEWNSTVEPGGGRKAQEDHLLDIAIQYGNLLAGGVVHAHFWPMRLPSKTRFTLLDDAGAPLPSMRVFTLYDGLRVGDRIAHAAPERDVYALRYRRDGGAGHVLVNTGAKPWRVRIDGAAAAGVDGVVAGRSGDIESYPACSAWPQDSAVVVPLPARSVIRVRQFRAE